MPKLGHEGTLGLPDLHLFLRATEGSGYVMYTRNVLVGLTCLLLLGTTIATAAITSLNLSGGETVSVACGGTSLDVTRVDPSNLTLVCHPLLGGAASATHTVPPALTATVAPHTATPKPSNTAAATSPPSNTPSPTKLPVQTPTPVPPGDAQWALVCNTTLDASGQSQCGSSRLIPVDRFFCDRWFAFGSAGVCQDFRDKHADEQAFPQPSDEASLDCLSSTSAAQTSGLPYYVPTNNSDNTDVPGSELIPFPCGFAQNEHFMTRMEDGQFGMVVMREQRPFDFAWRTGHIHFDVDMKTRAPLLSPDAQPGPHEGRHGRAASGSTATARHV